MFELPIDLQLDAAHGEQEQPRLGPSRPHEVADPELPLPDARRDRVSVYSTPLWFMGNPMPPAMRVEPKSSICSMVHASGRSVDQAVSPARLRCLARDPLMPLSIGLNALRKRSMVAWRRRLIPRVMQCPAGICLGSSQKVQCSANADAGTKQVPPPYLSMQVGPPDFPLPSAVPPAWPHAVGRLRGHSASRPRRSVFLRQLCARLHLSEGKA